jgi:hypothetical protein
MTAREVAELLREFLLSGDADDVCDVSTMDGTHVYERFSVDIGNRTFEVLVRCELDLDL